MDEKKEDLGHKNNMILTFLVKYYEPISFLRYIELHVPINLTIDLFLNNLITPARWLRYS